MSKLLVFLTSLSLLALSNAELEISPSIIGGRNASLGQFPYMVSFQSKFNRGTHGCGGGIVSDRWILSAAHCVPNNDEALGVLIAVVGTIDMNTGGAEYELERGVAHPNYIPNRPPYWMNNINDIGLFKTKNRIIFNDFVRPIPLNSRTISGRVSATVAGFGVFFTNITTNVTMDDIVMSPQLRFLDTNTISSAECSIRAQLYQARNPASFWRPMIHPISHICTVQPPGFGTCFGDSGSMLISNGEAIGVVVSGVSICAHGAPDIFARISTYVEWINRYINES